jgi:hypothetical protein
LRIRKPKFDNKWALCYNILLNSKEKEIAMTKYENLEELLSLLTQAQDLIGEIFGDADEAFDMSINLSNVISDAENLMELQDFIETQNLTINGVSVTIES